LPRGHLPESILRAVPLDAKGTAITIIIIII
jgi:hypothetical protein